MPRIKQLRQPPITETAEHLVIAAYLRRYGLGDALMIHLRGERAGAKQRATAWRMGVISGLPDWMVLHGIGQVGFIELKPRGWKAKRAKFGSYTEHEHRQLSMHERLRNAGAWVVVCETLDEILHVLRQHGIALMAETLSEAAVRRGAERAAAAE